MSSDQSFVDFVVEQMESAGSVTSRKMFGGYAVYCDEKMVGLICDNQVFIKPTDAGRDFIGIVTERPPFAGAKPYFVIEERLEDRE